MEPFFMSPWVNICEENCHDLERSEEEQKEIQELKQIELQKVQSEATEKQRKRTELMGELLRSKGFLWLATSNNVTGCWQQAGNVVRIEEENPWMCLMADMWQGTEAEAEVLKDMIKPDGEEWEYKDRRQEIVFIGHGMKKDVIQELLDSCLLTDKEMAMGP